MKKPAKAHAPRPETRLHGLYEDLVLDTATGCGILDFAKHIGLQLPTTPGTDWWPHFLGHYLNGTGSKARVDEARVGRDFASFPPIATRVAELRKQAA